MASSFVYIAVDKKYLQYLNSALRTASKNYIRSASNKKTRQESTTPINWEKCLEIKNHVQDGRVNYYVTPIDPNDPTYEYVPRKNNEQPTTAASAQTAFSPEHLAAAFGSLLVAPQQQGSFPQPVVIPAEPQYQQPQQYQQQPQQYQQQPQQYQQQPIPQPFPQPQQFQ